jgi:CHAT domain-containing protein
MSQLALTTVLRRKGLVLDAVADNAQILRSQLANKPEIKKIFDEWLNVLQQQSKLVYGEQRTQTPDKYKATFEQLEAQRQRLEGAISAQSAEFRNEIQPVELAAIQAKIPKGAALVEIVQYQPFNAKANKPNERWGKQRYAAAVLHSVGEPKWVDLGEAAVIDQSIMDTRAALTNRTLLKPAQELAWKLDKQVMAPIRPLLGNVRHVLLSPDGQLTLFPFEALRDEQGQYLIQRYTVSYLTSGRDLLRFQLPAKSRFEPVVLADIDYEQQETTGEKPKLTNVRGSQKRRSADLASLNFEPLPNTKEEAAVIQKVLPNVKLLLGKEATETALKQLHAPSILHLATHGFFISDQQQNFNPSLTEFGQPQPKVLQIENPLLRSGLALAGINKRNRTSADNDDGVLTALEVTGLDLRGTQLVVLSACETGAGDIKVGEGVYGLRRALVIAGSSSQILSFWALGDEETKNLMVKYYQKLKAGKGRHEALREAQLEFLNTPGYEHPYFWASFTPSGNWTPLSLK